LSGKYLQPAPKNFPFINLRSYKKLATISATIL
jgi:hypothetical protein